MPEVPEHWYQPIAEFLGPAYLRYSFTKGTVQEVDFLLPRLGLDGGGRLLDAGCGPGRHSLEFARRGVDVVGVDVAPRFVDLAREAAAAEGLSAGFRLGDLRTLDVEEDFDAVVTLCQGGFGLAGGDPEADRDILSRLVRALRPGGRLAATAFHAFFALRHLGEDEVFDPATGLHHETVELRNEDGVTRRAEADTVCSTARELYYLARLCGLDVEGIWGVTPGGYAEQPPSVDVPELLLLASRPHGRTGRATRRS